MKKRRALAFACCLLLAVQSGCGAPVPAAPSAEPLPAPTPEATQEAAAYPLYLPLPYYNTFYPEAAQSGNIDAFLHNTAVNYYSTRVSPTSGDLLIPSLRLLDEWEDGEGGTYYLCLMAGYDYYGLAQTLTGEEPYENSAYDGSGYALGGLIRFRVTPEDQENGYVENYWGFEAVEILSQPPWGTEGGHIRALCGERPIARALLAAEETPGGTRDLPYLRDILPGAYAHDMPGLLSAYLERYFPEMNTDITWRWNNTGSLG